MDNHTSEDIKIFYSWQSDLVSNQKIIRLALKKAKCVLEIEYQDRNMNIEIMEATRGDSGSPNISDAIFSKITQADIFICDITTINSESPECFRRVPNPNILIELGYSISQLGWNRIVMVFNKKIGDIDKDLPFDIRNNRCMSYSILIAENQKIDTGSINNLGTMLKDAIKGIIETKPEKGEKLNKEESEMIKRERDVRNLRWIFSTFSISGINLQIQSLPFRINNEALYYWESFDSAYKNSMFFVYSEDLKDLIDNFHQTWGETFKFGDYYFPNSLGFVKFDTNKPNSDELLDEIEKEKVDLHDKLNNLIDYVRRNYVEIDVDELSKKAFLEYKEFMGD